MYAVATQTLLRQIPYVKGKSSRLSLWGNVVNLKFDDIGREEGSAAEVLVCFSAYRKRLRSGEYFSGVSKICQAVGL